MLELRDRDGLARICRFETAHGTVETPTLLPVIHPRQLVIPPKEMKELFGTQMIITNSYIIRKTDGLRQEALEKGLHGLLDFDGPIMTDSGTFQSHVYGEVDVDPLEIVEFQRDVGSDVGTILDIFTEPDATRVEASAAIDKTVERARQTYGAKGDMTLALPVQGSVFPDLREECARKLTDVGEAFHPIGGVVPLMESYRYSELAEVILASKRGLDPSRPVHLFGCGHPMLFPMAALLGCDFFDSSSYVKYARDGRMLFPDGTRHLKEMRSLPCACPVCASHTPAELLAFPEQERVRKLAEHNLYVSFAELEVIKEAISEGRLWELVAARARVHPDLLAALVRLKGHAEYLERFTPISRTSAFFYTGPESAHRPIVQRYRKRFFERYAQPEHQVLVGFEDGVKPYSRHQWANMKEVLAVCDAHFLVSSFFGPVPIELDEMYPIAQSLVPRELDPESLRAKAEAMERHAHGHGYDLGVMWDGKDTVDFLASHAPGKGTFDIDRARVRAVADMQFGRGAADALFSGKVELVKSPKTGKIRNVRVDGEHVVSMRAGDGLFTLKKAGAVKLHQAFPPPRLRVIVLADSVEFNLQGKNAFTKFVLECNDELRPGDEALVVDENDRLVAFGRVPMNREEMLAFSKGVAVKVREGMGGKA